MNELEKKSLKKEFAGAVIFLGIMLIIWTKNLPEGPMDNLENEWPDQHE